MADSLSVVQEVRRLAQRAGLCDVHPAATITKGMAGESLTERRVDESYRRDGRANGRRLQIGGPEVVEIRKGPLHRNFAGFHFLKPGTGPQLPQRLDLRGFHPRRA